MLDHELLSAYADQQDELAFEELVQRYQDMVHSACLRRLGDAALAQDAAQTTFLLLAQRAENLRDHLSVGGWLYQTAMYQSANMLRRERRRDQVQKDMQRDPSTAPSVAEPRDEAVDEIRPHLDEALLALGQEERDAVVMRFFGNRSLRDMGAALGTTEDAARKRVARAVERLGAWFRRRGFGTVSAAAIVALLDESTQAAPVELLPKITTSAHGASLVSRATAREVRWTKVKDSAFFFALAVLTIAWGWRIEERMRHQQANLVATPTPAPAAVTPWQPEIERPGALSLTLRDAPSPLVSMLANVWAVESRRGTQAKLTLLRETLGLTDAQAESASSALERAQVERAELVQSLSQGEVQFENVARFLRAERNAMAAIETELSAAQRASLRKLEEREARDRAANVARWRLADLNAQLGLGMAQRTKVHQALFEHSLAFDIEAVVDFAGIDGLMKWLDARTEDEQLRLKAELTPEQYRAYLDQPAADRLPVSFLRGDGGASTP